jgi:hypothetical protein
MLDRGNIQTAALPGPMVERHAGRGVVTAYAADVNGVVLSSRW